MTLFEAMIRNQLTKWPQRIPAFNNSSIHHPQSQNRVKTFSSLIFSQIQMSSRSKVNQKTMEDYLQMQNIKLQNTYKLSQMSHNRVEKSQEVQFKFFQTIQQPKSNKFNSKQNIKNWGSSTFQNMEEGTKQNQNSQRDNRLDNMYQRTEFAPKYDTMQRQQNQQHVPQYEAYMGTYFNNQNFGQNYEETMQMNQHQGPEPNFNPYIQVQQPMHDYSHNQYCNDNQNSIFPQQFVPMQSQQMQSQDLKQLNKRITDFTIQSSTHDTYPHYVDSNSKSSDFIPQGNQETFNTPTKNLRPSMQISQGQVRFNDQSYLISTEMTNLRKQQIPQQLQPQPWENQKIPQSAQVNQRKVSYTQNDIHENIYFQEGNYDGESVNNLTDIQDPSVESNSVNIYHKQSEHIDNLLNDDEDLSYRSDKIKPSKRGESLDKDNTQPLIPNTNKGPNSVNSQSFYIPIEVPNFQQNVSNQGQVNNTYVRTSPNLGPNQYNPVPRQIYSGEQNQYQGTSGKIGYIQKPYYQDYNSDIQNTFRDIQQNQEFIMNKMSGQYHPVSKQQADWRNSHSQHFIRPDAQFQQMNPHMNQQFQNYETSQINQSNQYLNPNQQHQTHEQYMNVIRGLQQQCVMLSQMNTQTSGSINQIQIQPNKARQSSLGVQENEMNDTYRNSNNHSGLELSHVNISENFNLDRGGNKWYNKIQADNKSDSREETKRNYFQTKGNPYSRLSEWKGSNSQYNYRKKYQKEIDPLVVSFEGIDDQDIMYRKKTGSQTTQRENRQPSSKGPISIQHPNVPIEKEVKSQDFVGSGESGSHQKGSQGYPSKTTATHGSHCSRESNDEFMQQIQHEIKMANEDPEEEYKILQGNIIHLAKKKVGSRFLQDHLQKAKQPLINKILEEINGHIVELMMDNYGNYFCSKLIECLQAHQRVHFLKQMKGDLFVKISCNQRGTWALQNIIQVINLEEEFDLVKETLMQNNNIVRVAKDGNGKHMIEKLIKLFPENRRQFIFDEIMANFSELATDQQGLCAMKELIKKSKNNLNHQQQIINKIQEKVLMYVQNEFGNFVVSEVLEYFDFSLCEPIFKSIEGNFVKLSQNKYSSKFIENSIQIAPVELQNMIIQEFIQSEFLYKVVQSNYGNYVLQNTLEKYSKCEETKLDLIEAIINCLLQVSEFKLQQKWGKEILVKHLKDFNNPRIDKLAQMLEDVMFESEDNHQNLKQQQSLKMSKMKFNDKEIKYKKSSAGSNSSGQAANVGGQYYSGNVDYYEQENEYQQRNQTGYRQAQGNNFQRSNKNQHDSKKNQKRGDRLVIDKSNIKFANKKF